MESYEYICENGNDIDVDDGTFFFEIKIKSGSIVDSIAFGFICNRDECNKFLNFCKAVTNTNDKVTLDQVYNNSTFNSYGEGGCFHANMHYRDNMLMFYCQTEHASITKTISLDNFVAIAIQICESTSHIK